MGLVRHNRMDWLFLMTTCCKTSVLFSEETAATGDDDMGPGRRSGGDRRRRNRPVAAQPPPRIHAALCGRVRGCSGVPDLVSHQRRRGAVAAADQLHCRLPRRRAREPQRQVWHLRFSFCNIWKFSRTRFWCGIPLILLFGTSGTGCINGGVALHTVAVVAWLLYLDSLLEKYCGSVSCPWHARGGQDIPLALLSKCSFSNSL